MALYSETIDINSKWMWSSITTGTIGVLFLAGAFWGLSASMNNAPALFTTQTVAYLQPIGATKVQPIPAKVAVKTAKPSNGKPSLAKSSKINNQKVNRSGKQNSTFANAPKIALKPKVKSLIATPKAVTTNNKPNNPILVASKAPSDSLLISGAKTTTLRQSNLSRKSLTQTQLASLQIEKPVAKTASIISSSTSVEPKTAKEFKIVDVNVKVKKGDTLVKILKRNGASATEAQNIVNKLKPHVKVNALEIGQPLTLTLDRRTNNTSIHPIKLIIPLGYRANKPAAILEDRVSISYDQKNQLVLNLPTNELASITMRPKKPLKAPKFTPAPPKALDNKSTNKLSLKIASIAKDEKSKAKSGTSGTSRKAYYRTRSWVKGSFKKTIAAQRVPKDVQSRLISVYNQTARTKKIKKGDVLEVLYDQTESSSGKLQKLGKLLYINYKANGKVYTYYRFGSQFYDANGKSINATSGGTVSSGGKRFMVAPVPGAKMTSKFGMRRHPVYRRWKMHSGTDFAAPRGTPIYAAASGKVTVARWYGGAGRYVQINHLNGYMSGYMHMTRFAKGVKKGRSVKQGQIIGYVGSTGTATGNHLHFEVRRNGKKINPQGMIGRGRIASSSTSGGKLKGSQLSKFKKEKTRISRALKQTSALERIAKR